MDGRMGGRTYPLTEMRERNGDGGDDHVIENDYKNYVPTMIAATLMMTTTTPISTAKADDGDDYNNAEVNCNDAEDDQDEDELDGPGR